MDNLPSLAGRFTCWFIVMVDDQTMDNQPPQLCNDGNGSSGILGRSHSNLLSLWTDSTASPHWALPAAGCWSYGRPGLQELSEHLKSVGGFLGGEGAVASGKGVAKTAHAVMRANSSQLETSATAQHSGSHLWSLRDLASFSTYAARIMSRQWEVNANRALMLHQGNTTYHASVSEIRLSFVSVCHH